MQMKKWALALCVAARKTCGLALVLAAFSSSAFAKQDLPALAPEIDPGSMASALALLAGGVLLFTGRFQRK